MHALSRIARQAVELMCRRIAEMGFIPAVHFELEGTVRPQTSADGSPAQLDYPAINRALARASLHVRIKPEYWQNQWELVSLFEGQTPLREADNLVTAIELLPRLLKRHGADEVYIKPVVWGGDQGGLADDCQRIFSEAGRDIHIPNAVQLNLSISTPDGDNLMASGPLGEILQQCLLRSSYACSLIFLPEQEAYQRLRLKHQFGLGRELSSPTDLSGGHRGSIALYRKHGKHDQAMGVEPLLLDQHANPLTSKQNWQRTARIEHRLGASSRHYNPYLNVAFALANVVEALELFSQPSNHIVKTFTPRSLPASLHGVGDQPGALQLFAEDHWLPEVIHRCQQRVIDERSVSTHPLPPHLGSELKLAVLDYYREIADPVAGQASIFS